MKPTTILPWPGHAYLPGAFLISRINLTFINKTCSKLSQNLDIATQVASALSDTKLINRNASQINQYGYMFFKLALSLKHILNYVTNLLLCSGRGGELWGKFTLFNRQLSQVWIALRKAGLTQTFTPVKRIRQPLTNSTQDLKFTLTNKGKLNDQNETTVEVETDKAINVNDMNVPLLRFLEQARPTRDRRAKGPLLLGLAFGFLGSTVLSKFFGSKSDQEIAALNNNLQRNSKLIKLTNERIDS